MRVDPEQIRGLTIAQRQALIAVLLLAGFAVLALIVSGTNELAVDVRLLGWIQGRSWPVLEALGNVTNWLFDGTPLTIVLALFLVLSLAKHWRDEALIVLLIALIRPVNGVLKRLIDSPRPGPEFVHDADAHSGLGFPSGHTAGAVLLCGFIAWASTRRTEQAWIRRSIWAGMILVVGITGFGRMWVGAHWPSDVLGGMLWASAALILVIAITPRMLRSKMQ